MLKWALIFFVIAIIAAVLGFGGIAGAASSIASILFWIFVVLFVISLIMHFVGGKKVERAFLRPETGRPAPTSAGAGFFFQRRRVQTRMR